jgi:hypothetical protein
MLPSGRTVSDYPVDAGSLTASVRFTLGPGDCGAARTRRTAALPGRVRVSDMRVRCTPRGSMSCAWRRRGTTAAGRARSIA